MIIFNEILILKLIKCMVAVLLISCMGVFGSNTRNFQRQIRILSILAIEIMVICFLSIIYSCIKMADSGIGEQVLVGMLILIVGTVIIAFGIENAYSFENSYARKVIILFLKIEIIFTSIVYVVGVCLSK